MPCGAAKERKKERKASPEHRTECVAVGSRGWSSWALLHTVQRHLRIAPLGGEDAGVFIHHLPLVLS